MSAHPQDHYRKYMVIANDLLLEVSEGTGPNRTRYDGGPTILLTKLVHCLSPTAIGFSTMDPAKNIATTWCQPEANATFTTPTFHHHLKMGEMFTIPK